jgi:urate oxidase
MPPNPPASPNGAAPSPTAGTRLGENSYGKSGVRLMKVRRPGPHGGDMVTELTVDIALKGDFEDIHRGDNSKCLPTDTMKNTVYALARSHKLDTIESFALHLAQHFVESHGPATSAKVSIHERAWGQGAVGGKPHPHFFCGHAGDAAACEATFVRGERWAVRSGICDLTILKTADSAFTGFPRDKYTTLKETEDRLFCTSLTAWWDYAPGAAANYKRAWFAVREALVATFANHKSRSVQHTLHEMGKAALAACPEAQRIRLSMPNKHCLLVDLTHFGLDNRNEVFVPTDEPYGLIEAMIERE